MIYFCSFCGAEYTTRGNSNKKYCSRSCKEKARAKRVRDNNPNYNKEKYERRKTNIKPLFDKVKVECAHCGNNDTRVLDFHHINPETKSFELSKWTAHTRKEIEEEINKCIILCANCHRIVHYEDRNLSQ